MNKTVFNRCGGFATVRKVVSAFYDKLLDSPGLQGYFEDVDMARLIDHQTKFIAYIMGGPVSIGDDVLRRSHAHLHISHDEFVEMAGLLREACEDFDMDPDDIDQVHQAIMDRESFIVAPDKAPAHEGTGR